MTEYPYDCIVSPMVKLLLTLFWYASLLMTFLFEGLFMGYALLGLDYPFLHEAGVFGACFMVYAIGAPIFDQDVLRPWSRIWSYYRERAGRNQISLHDAQDTHYSAVPVGEGFYLVRIQGVTGIR